MADDLLFRTEPPWNQEDGADIPEGHAILAELPAVQWGWEGDMYFWILRDLTGRIYLGTSCHGKFYEAKTQVLEEQIRELQSYIDATQQALKMLTPAHALPMPTSEEGAEP